MTEPQGNNHTVPEHLECPNCEESIEWPKTADSDDSFPCPKCAFLISRLTPGKDGAIKTFAKLSLLVRHEGGMPLLSFARKLIFSALMLMVFSVFVLFLFGGPPHPLQGLLPPDLLSPKGKQTCMKCNGTGGCQRCNYLYFLQFRCNQCGWSGICPNCNGKGVVNTTGMDQKGK